MLVTRITLNNQGRLVLRDNGKLIIPYEQFANAIMMKHLEGPHGVHLSLEGTIRAVMESFTVGREQFGMEKEFIIEMVQNCPNPACRYYKNHVELSQNTSSIGPSYSQDAETVSSTLLRQNYSHNPEFQTKMNTSISSNMGLSLSDASENRNNNNQRSQNHSSSHKKGNTKVYDSSLSVLPSSELLKIAEFSRSNVENFENLHNFQAINNSGKESLSFHNSMWTLDTEIKSIHSTTMCDGQEKVVRAFAEVMKNMSRMKTCVRPAMCKPYGKQSETLQKTLVDTIQLIQSLRSFLPPPHIPVSSWKNEDKHGMDHANLSFLPVL